MRNIYVTGVLVFIPFIILAQATDKFIDTRDGTEYKTIQIGTQVWMAENLNFSTPNSWCIECETYGRLYNYNEAISACPDGWHLSSDLDWTILVGNLGGFTTAGGKLKESGINHWKKPNKFATNESGFNAIPHGYRSVNGILNFENKMGFWWTSTENEKLNSWSIRIDYDKNNVTRQISNKDVGLSVRCVKDYF
jgi:uncharacterized protein (TIGR02145 family)